MSKEQQEKSKTCIVFDNVAPTYDRMGTLLSFGLWKIWRKTFVNRINPKENTKLIDMATGTGEIAFLLLDHIKKNKIKNCHVTACDINPFLLIVAKDRSKALDVDPSSISWAEEDAENTPFADGSFDIYAISFGVRNGDARKVLQEAYRILKPGGRFFCLEFGHIENYAIRYITEQFKRYVWPILTFIAGARQDTYQYLLKSIEKFPNQKSFKMIIEEAGFHRVTYENLYFGVVAIYSAYKQP